MRFSIDRIYRFPASKLDIAELAMLSNDLLLQSANKRLQFWRDQLQAAFRCGDAKRAAECALLIDEYGVLTAAAMAQFLTAADSTSVSSRVLQS